MDEGHFELVSRIDRYTFFMEIFYYSERHYVIDTLKFCSAQIKLYFAYTYLSGDQTIKEDLTR